MGKQQMAAGTGLQRRRTALTGLLLAIVWVTGCNTVGQIRFAMVEDGQAEISADGRSALLKDGKLRLSIEKGLWVRGHQVEFHTEMELVLRLFNQGAAPLRLDRTSLALLPLGAHKQASTRPVEEWFALAKDYDPPKGWLLADHLTLEPGRGAEIPIRWRAFPHRIALQYQVGDRPARVAFEMGGREHLVPWFLAPSIDVSGGE